MTVTDVPARVAWAHDVHTDPPLPTGAVTAWLRANGVTSGRTVRVEIHAGTPPILVWWELAPDADGCTRCRSLAAAYRNHRQGPYETPLTVPLPPVLAARDGDT